jgi:hypothetical protein
MSLIFTHSKHKIGSLIAVVLWLVLSMNSHIKHATVITILKIKQKPD